MTEQALERGATRVRGFDDAEMDFQLIRQMGVACYGGSAIGECLALAREIADGHPASWVEHFEAAARRWETDAQARAARGHRVSAHGQYLVASNNYRAAEYYSGVEEASHARCGQRSRECFLAAMHLSDGHFETVELPWEGGVLPAYYARAAGAGDAPGKTLMIISGYDGTLEETWLAYGLPALQRGYNLMLFAGPGQADSMRFNPGQAFIPEFERIGALAVAHVLDRPQTDPRRLALMGISFGGYFATRIAAHEPRVRALIANSPIVDLHAYMTSFVGFDPATLSDADDFGLAELPHIPDEVMPPQQRRMAGNLIRRLGCTTFREAYVRLRDFRVGDAELARIACPVLALSGSGEGREVHAQAERFCQGVSGPASAWQFSVEEGADGHCQSGNLGFSAAVSMDWLDEAFQ